PTSGCAPLSPNPYALISIYRIIRDSQPRFAGTPLARRRGRAMKSVCFHCQFVGVGVQGPRCPVCAYPLIVNTEPVAIAAGDLHRMFQKPLAAAPVPLPGVSDEPRPAQILMQRRRARIEALTAQKRTADPAAAPVVATAAPAPALRQGWWRSLQPASRKRI